MDQKIDQKRIRKSYSNIPGDLMAVVDGLIRRAAYMKIQLEDYEQDLCNKGYVEMFTQSKNLEPFERERPVVRLYNATVKNYAAITRQLSDLLPKEQKPSNPEDDDFKSFISGN